MTWLARLKNSKASRGYATETTKTQRVGAEGVSVVSVAPLSGGFQKFEGDRHGVDAGDAARLVASSEGGLDHTTERASDPSTTGDQSRHGAKAIAAAAAPLVQEKILKAPATHATKPTKPGFVGFVAYLQGTSGNSRPARTCATCSRRLAPGTCSQPVRAGLAPHFAIRWPPEGWAQRCPAYTDKPRPQASKTWDHAPAGNEELATMSERQARFERLGLTYEEAGRAADRLLIRDREGDDRRLCLECHHLRGRPGAWRCNAPGMPAPLVATLQRCHAFREAP